MSREEEEYVVSQGLKQIPIKWTAPEALNFGQGLVLHHLYFNVFNRRCRLGSLIWFPLSCCTGCHFINWSISGHFIVIVISIIIITRFLSLRNACAYRHKYRIKERQTIKSGQVPIYLSILFSVPTCPSQLQTPSTIAF